MKHALLLLLCLSWVASVPAQDIAVPPTPTPSPTPTPTPTPSAVSTPAPAAVQAPRWLWAESTSPGVAPLADPGTTVLRSKFEPIIVKQGHDYVILFTF